MGKLSIDIQKKEKIKEVQMAGEISVQEVELVFSGLVPHWEEGICETMIVHIGYRSSLCLLVSNLLRQFLEISIIK